MMMKNKMKFLTKNKCFRSIFSISKFRDREYHKKKSARSISKSWMKLLQESTSSIKSEIVIIMQAAIMLRWNCSNYQPSYQRKHNFSIIIVDYIRLGRMANVQHSQKLESPSRAASNKQWLLRISQTSKPDYNLTINS
jgi:hypothetical protein